MRFFANRSTAFLLATLCLACTPAASAQEDAWIRVVAGEALYLEPYEGTWVPLTAREQVPLHTYALTKPGAEATLYWETEAVPLPTDAYFYLADALPKTQVALVAALTRIEAAQLPRTAPDGSDPNQTLGLVYGRPADAAPLPDIPYAAERAQAVQAFYEAGRADAALLSLKRTMTKYPMLYTEEAYAERLLHLYDELALYGFLLDESKRLLGVEGPEAFGEMVRHWHGVARQRLQDR